MFRFKCTQCDEWHVGMPALDTREPMPVASMTKAERQARCIESSDAFIVDKKDYYVRGCLETAVRGLPDGFSWGVWVSPSEASLITYLESYEVPNRSYLGPFVGWLVSVLPYDEPTFGLKTRVHLRDDGIRPFIEVEPTDHPLAIEQRDGMALQRLEQIYARCLHGASPH